MADAPELKIGTSVDLTGATQMNQFEASVTESLTKIVELMSELEVKEEEVAEETESAFARMREAAAKNMEAVNASLKGTSGVIGGFGALLGVGLFVEFLDHMKESVLEVNHLAEATGMSVTSIVEMKDAMNAAGVSTERLPQQLTKMAQAINAASQGSQKQVEAFKDLGVNTDGWSKKLPDTNSVLLQMADHLQKSSANTRDLAEATTLLGRGAVGMTAWLKEGSAAIKEQEAAAEEHAHAVKDSVEAAKEFQRQTTALKESLETLLLPVFKSLIGLTGGLRSAFAGAAVVVYAAGGSLLSMGEAAIKAQRAVTGLLPGTKALTDALDDQIKHIESWKANLTQLQGEAYKQFEKANADIAKSMLAKPKEEEGGEDGGADRSKLREELALQALENRKAMSEARIKLAEAEAKQTEEISARSAQIDMLQSKLASSKNLDDRRQYISQLENLMKDGAKKEEDNAIQAAEARYQVEKKYLQQSMALHDSGSIQDIKEREKLKGQLQVLEIDHQEKLVTINTTYQAKILGIEKQTAQAEMKIRQEAQAQAITAQEEALKGQEQVLSDEVKRNEQATQAKIKALEDELKFHQITLGQELADVTNTYKQEEAEAVRLLERKRELYLEEVKLAAQKNGQILSDEEAKLLPGVRKVDDEILAEKQKANARIEEENRKFVAQQMKAANEMANVFQRAYSTMVLQSSSFSEAVGKTWQNLQKTFVDIVFNMIAQWMEAMAQGQAFSLLQSLKQITAKAYEAAANAYAATSSIPIIGPALAPAAAAVTFAAVEAFGAGVPSAAGGMVVPADNTLALLHEKEMVLPQHISAGLNKMIQGGVQPPSAGGSHVTFSPNIQALDGKDVMRVLQGNLPALGQAVTAAVKGGHVKIGSISRAAT